LPVNVPVLLFVGRMMWYKNIGKIIEALGMLHGESFDFRMVFVGDGNDLDGAVRLAESKGLSNKVFFSGRVSDRELLRAYFTRADLFVFPSVYDNAPLVVREAAACSCPSLVVRGSSASEILEDGVNGFFADETPEGIAGVIKAVFSDRAKLDEVTRNAAEQVYISWDAAIEDSIARYGEAIGSFKGKGGE